jgi:IS5 family transposase
MKADTQPEFADFYLPFDGKLSPANRWVKLAALVPWDTIEERYAAALAGTGMGAPPMSGRIAFGALIIKERLGVTDEETVLQIYENPYLQHFLGYREMLKEPPFDPSMMVHFRSRFGQDDFDIINREIIRMARLEAGECVSVSLPCAETETEVPKSGKLLIDATATPADITYPTDLKLLNAAREKTEHIIDILHEPQIGTRPKPRTYRQKARLDFLAITKLKRPGARKIRKWIGKQLRYLRRNLRHIDELVEAGSNLESLSRYDYGCLITTTEIYRQQLKMWTEKTHRIADRIVSLSQPWVRPIVRGKASAKTEFGAKISIGVAAGYCTLHRLSWDAYNECADLPEQAESYREAHGCYPESIHADKIYRTRANRAWCKEKGIRLSGPPLGRPAKETEENAEKLAVAKRQERQDEIDRNGVEGKFGNAKRKGTLDRVMAKLKHTSQSVINVALIVLNLDTRLREVLCWLWSKLMEQVKQLVESQEKLLGQSAA